MSVVWLDGRARRPIQREALDRRLLETGGALFGWTDGDEVVIACASGPGTRATHRPRRFETHPATTATAMRCVHVASEGRYGYVGSWHTHPYGRAIPSSLDATTAWEMSEQAGLALPQPVLLIISTTGLGRHVTVADSRAWRWDRAVSGLVHAELRDCELDDYYAPAATELFMTPRPTLHGAPGR